MKSVTENCYDLVKKLNLNPRIVEHEPILNFEIAYKVDEELGLTGAETKSLLLKNKQNEYYLFITYDNERMDSKILKELLGEKVKLVSPEEMISVAEQTPGSMTPFGLNIKIKGVVINPQLFEEEKLILGFGSPTISAEMTALEFKTLLDQEHENIIFLQKD